MYYRGKGNKQYTLEQNPFAQGGEGKVYNVIGNSQIVAKIYKNGLNTQDKERKLVTMVDNPPEKSVMSQISWPLDVLYDNQHVFVGFIMPKLSINEDLNVIYEFGPSAKYPKITWSNKIVIAKNLCAVLDAVHEAGHVVGDFNPKNISVDPTSGHIVFVDTDSYHIEDGSNVYRCNVGMPEYLPAEIQKKMKNGLSNATLPTFTQDTDNFALAVHIFQLLMNGTHPFSCRILPSQASVVFPQPTDNILNGVFPFMQPQSGTDIPVYAPSIDILPAYIKDLFSRAFIAGYSNPSKRPTPEEWHAALCKLEGELCKCPSESYHEFHNHLTYCPWCKADQNFYSGVRRSNKKPLSQSNYSPINPPPTTKITPPSNNGTYGAPRSSSYTTYKRKKPFLKFAIIASIIAVLAMVITFVVIGVKVGNVEDMIDALPNDPQYYLDYQAEILDAYAAYEELGDFLKSQVDNSDKLLACVDELKVQEAYEMRQSMEFTKLESGGYSVKLKEGGNANMQGELVIPAVYRQAPVIAIEDYGFENCRSVTSIIVPDSITKIGVGAFKGCNNVTSITIPFTGQSADATAHNAVFGFIFGYETQQAHGDDDPVDTFVNQQYGNVEQATWQYSRINHDYYNSVQTFYYYVPRSIKTVVVSNQNIVQDAAFNNCAYIESISYSQSITYLGTAAFQNCESLSRFNSETEKTLNLAGEVEKVGAYAFRNCKKITNVIVTNNITIIENNSFEGCKEIVELNIPTSISFIGDYAFKDLKRITSISISDNTTTIGKGAFQGCNSVVDVVIPFTGRSVDATAYNAVFGYIFGYETQQAHGNDDPVDTFVNQQYGHVEQAVWQYSRINHDYYNSVQTFYYYIPNSIRNVTITNQSSVQNAAFNNCKYIEKISYSETIEYFGTAALQNCESLKSFNSDTIGTADLSGEAKKIDNYFMKNCSLINNIILQEGLSIIGEYAFENTAIVEMIIPKSTSEVQRGALKSCDKLTKLTLPFIGKSREATAYNAVFGFIFGYETQQAHGNDDPVDTFVNQQYGNMEQMTWQYSRINHDYYNSVQSFYYHIPVSLKNVIITDQTKVPTAAFNGCTNILNITFEKGISTQGEAAFQNCTANIIK